MILRAAAHRAKKSRLRIGGKLCGLGRPLVAWPALYLGNGSDIGHAVHSLNHVTQVRGS
jgi:hypothetical protein